MDLPSHKNYRASPLLSSSHGGLEGKIDLFGRSKENPFPDPLCKLNLRETSEFVKSFPMSNSGSTESREGCNLQGSAQRRREEGSNSVTNRRLETPSTPGRPIFCFTSVGNLSRKNFPSKWDDAEKWLISSSCHESPAHPVEVSENSNISSQCENFMKQMEDLSEKSRITEERASNAVPSFQGPVSLDHNNSDIVLKDKFTDNPDPIVPKLRYSETTKEAFVFRNPGSEAMKDACPEMVHEVQHRDIGTEMTPLGSSTTSRCHTPFKSSSPARHNTPANRSGPLVLANQNDTSCTIDVIQLEECHFAKLQLGTQYGSVASNWSSREEEEEEISKSLRHSTSQKADIDCRATTWEEEEKTKCCLRYQREEAKIQAWVNLQSAKAEAQSRKLEVKIQKMKSNLEEKLMKRMTAVHRKADEWREEAKQQHQEQMQKATENAQKMMSRHKPHFSNQYHRSCGCFPCNNNIHHR